MQLDDYKPIPVGRFLGQVDYQDPTQVINGCAVKCQNSRFTADAVSTRYGRRTTMARPESLADATGFDVLEVLGASNPGQIPVVFNSVGELLIESPTGGGRLAQVPLPFALPSGARMQTTQLPNNLIMSFSDGTDGVCPPLQLNGPNGTIGSVSQNRPGMPWTAGALVQVGDLIRAKDGRWWRCTQPGHLGPNEPQWPANGQFIGGQAVSGGPETTGAVVYPAFFGVDSGTDTTAWFPPSGAGTWYVIVTLVSGGKEVAITVPFGPYVIGRTTQLVPGIPPAPPYFPGVPDRYINYYNLFRVTLPTAGAGDSFNVYIGLQPNAMTLVKNYAPNQTVILTDFRTFVQSPTGPQVASPTPQTSTAVWAPAIVVDAFGTTWEEWTPACTDTLPKPETPVVTETGGSIPGGDDVYVRIAFTSLAEGPWSDAAVLPNIVDGGVALAEVTEQALGGVVNVSIANYVVTLVCSPSVSPSVGDVIRASGLVSATFLNGQNLTVTDIGSTPWGHGFSLPYMRAAFQHANYSADDTGTVTRITIPQGGPRVPAWVASILNHPELFFGVNYNVYAAAVAHGAAAPTQYGLVGTFGLGQSVIVTAIPAANVAVPTTRRGGQIALIKDMAGTPTGLPNYFAGESGIRYVAMLRKSRTGSQTPIEPTAVFPAQFTNAGAQPVMFFPPPGPQISESMAALTVVGGSVAGPFRVIEKQDPEAPPTTAITALSRTNNVVTAVVKDIAGMAAGQVFTLTDPNLADMGVNGIDGFMGEFVLATVNEATKTVTWAQNGSGATVAQAKLGSAKLSVQATLPTVADASLAAISLNFDDTYLNGSLDVTAQLTMLGAPNASDAYFVPSLRRVVYVDNKSYPGAFIFSESDDPANITGSSQDENNPGSGILSVQDGAASRAVCVREMEDGEILGLKSNGGYRLNGSGTYPSLWQPIRKWGQVGPYTADTVAGATGENATHSFIGFMDREKGPYAYIQGQGLEWIGKEIQGTWKRVNKAALNTAWAAVDEVEMELKFGVPMDGAQTPNYELSCSYVQGWASPEVLNRYGLLISPREARRWSIQPLNARTAKSVKRELTGGAPALAADYPFTAISRTAGLVEATYADADSLPPVAIGAHLAISVPGDSSFDGKRRLLGKNAAVAQWVQDEIAELMVKQLAWQPDEYGNTLYRVTCAGGGAPLGVETGTGIYASDPNIGLSSVAILNDTGDMGFGRMGFGSAPFGDPSSPVDVVGAESFTFTCVAQGVRNPPSGSSTPTGIVVAFFNPPTDVVNAGAGISSLVSTIPSVPDDQRVATRQFLYGVSGASRPSQTYDVDLAVRSNGWVTILLGGLVEIVGSFSAVVLAGVDTQSFNGTFANASWKRTPQGTEISYAQPDMPDESSTGGTISTTDSALRIVMVTPDQRDDDGQGIDWQYQPWFTQKMPFILSFGGFRGQVRGDGRIIMQPLTDDPKITVKPHDILLDGSGISQHYERGLRLVNEHGSVLFTNDAEPGAWCEIQEYIMYAIEKFSGRRNT